jgi:hypothetical protein
MAGVAAACVALMTLAFTVLAGGQPLAARTAGAPPATLYVTQSSGVVTAGDTFTVEVRLRSEVEPANAVQADLSYPDAVARFESATVNTATWGVTAANGGGAGQVSIQVGSTTPVGGDVLVATVAFTAVADGTPAVAVAQSSLALAADGNRNLLVEDAVPPPFVPPVVDDDPPGAEAVRARVRRVRWSGSRKLRVRLGCPAAASSRCRVRLSVHTRAGRRVGKAKVISIPAARTRTAVLQLSKTTARRLRRHPREFRLRVRTTTSAGVLSGRLRLDELR